MYFAPNNAALPLELFCIRAAAAVQTPQERADLIAAWKLCLINGPSPLRRRALKTQTKLQTSQLAPAGRGNTAQTSNPGMPGLANATQAATILALS